MAAEPFARPQRDDLMVRTRDLWSRLYPKEGEPPVSPESDRIREAYYQGLAEYGDRLPRVPLGISPFTGDPLLHTFDPYGFDGWWWHVELVVDLDEPRPPAGFQLLQGAVKLEREPTEVTEDAVKPGPEVPFVIPALLELPGMQAVIARVRLETGDVAYPISYWSEEEISPQELHQPWCREIWWFSHPETGQPAWSRSNALWDFDLAPWIAAGKVGWVDLEAENPELRREGLEFLLDLPGERSPQQFLEGERSYLELPDGAAKVPFGEADDEVEAPAMTPEEQAEWEAFERGE